MLSSESDFLFLSIPYGKLNDNGRLEENKKGPNNFIVKIEETMFDTDSAIIIGEYDEENNRFEGLVKISDNESNIESLVTIKNLKRNGHGVFKFPKGDLYLGNFEDDLMMGEGTYYFFETGSFVSGDIFKGDQVRGVGEFTWYPANNKKAVYNGDIFDGIPHGKGKV